MPATYEPIATTTLSSAAATITFSSIAASWTDLRVVLSLNGVSSTAAGLSMRFNSDSATNYSMTSLYGNGTSAASGRVSNATSMYSDSVATALSTTVPSLITHDIFSYAGSTFKTALTTISFDRNGSGSTERLVQLWRSTSAITSVALSTGAYTMNTGTTATLYGIKAA